jgi:hypothetical protein
MLTLIADELPRFMACNGSRLMPPNPRFNIDDTVRNEGNAAHWLIEQVHKGIHRAEELVNHKAPNGVFITEEMVEHVTPFLEAIQGRGMVECVTSHGDGKYYQVNGRADHIEYNSQSCRLDVSDFKYGWSIIEPYPNWTLTSHAIGWMNANPDKPVSKINFRIFQPRPHHTLGKIREWMITGNELRYAMIDLFRILSAPDDILNTGKYCKDCPAFVTCPAAQKAEMNAIDVSEMAYVADVDDKSLAFLLDNIARSLKILEQAEKAYSELALHRLKAGKIIPGYAKETELTNKQWKDGINVETAKILLGKDLSKPALITPAQAVKKGISQAAIDSLCERREKGAKLVRMDADTAVRKLFGGGKK